MNPKDPLTNFFENPDIFGMGGACVIGYVLVFMALMVLVFGLQVFDDR